MTVRSLTIGLGLLVVLTPLVLSQENRDPAAVQRGQTALQTRAFTTGSWSLSAYDNAWKYWGGDAKTPPADYAQAYRERYGLHPAPFANGKYPLGLREGQGLFGKALTTDCLLCHGGSLLGKSYVGLGNSTLDVQALFEEMGKASGGNGKLPFTFSNVRGTSEAAGFAVFLMGFREPDLKVRLQPAALDLHDDLCEDVPAWWLLKKKKTMYFTGSTPAQSVRSIMQFMLASKHGPAVFAKEEATFRDIQAYILSLTPPRYPFPIDQELAHKGEKVFTTTCVRCHGTYGPNWTYPNKVVPLDVIGTDPNRLNGLSERWGHYYNKSWFAQEKQGPHGYEYQVLSSKGYQAPPLDGVWATAPYLHNGSVPTLYNVLNSRSRPKVFTRSYRTNEEAYDKQRVGWKVQVLEPGAGAGLSPFERRKIYDTTLPGRSNRGHTFGDDLTETERWAVIEYLKTL